ncbi:MAG: type I-C CRISPR-associated protein Cas5c [Patescibacteria group bacterium]
MTGKPFFVGQTGKPFCVKFSGNFANFVRPEFRIEGVSYEVPTPSALRGMLESVFWHPEVRIQPLRLKVLKPIRLVRFRTNGIKEAATKDKPTIDVTQARTQMAQLILRDVAYLVEFVMHLTVKPTEDANLTKYEAMLTRRLDLGQYHHAPYFGRREFPADVAPADFESETALPVSVDLGYMFYDFHYEVSPKVSLYYNAIMENGVLNIPPREAAIATHYGTVQ